MTVIQTPVSHAQAAEELVQKIRGLHATVPGFELVAKSLDRFERPRAYHTLPDQLFVNLELALSRESRFAGAVAITPFDIRDMLEYNAAYLPAAAELQRFARGIRHAALSKRAKVGKLAIDAYRLARAMNLALDLGLIVPEVEDIRASLTRRRGTELPAPKSPEPPATDAPVATTARKP